MSYRYVVLTFMVSHLQLQRTMPPIYEFQDADDVVDVDIDETGVQLVDGSGPAYVTQSSDRPSELVVRSVS